MRFQRLVLTSHGRPADCTSTSRTFTTTERRAKPRSSHFPITIRSVCRTGLLSLPFTAAPNRPAGARRRPRALHRQLAPDRTREGRAPWHRLRGGRSRSAVAAAGPVRVRESLSRTWREVFAPDTRTVRFGELFRSSQDSRRTILPCVQGVCRAVSGQEAPRGLPEWLNFRGSVRKESQRGCPNPARGLHCSHEHLSLDVRPRCRTLRRPCFRPQGPAGVRRDLVRGLQ